MYDPTVGRFLTEDPSGLGPDTNPYRYVGNHTTIATDPEGLEETVFTQEGRVAGRAIEEALEASEGALTQQPLKRTLPGGGIANGRVDAITTAGQNIEIGPGSRTGLPNKLAQAGSAANADVILYKQTGKVPKAGSCIEYVRLSYDQAKKLAQSAKSGKWNGAQIWSQAASIGKTATTKVSSAAAAYAGPIFRRGVMILGTGSKVLSCFGISPIDVAVDAIDMITDPEGFRAKPAFMFPGMLVFPRPQRGDQI